MVSITEHAAELLADVLAMNASDPRQALRIYYINEDVYMDMDYPQEGDDMIESEGCVIVVLAPEVSLALRDAVIDCIHSPDGARLTIHPAVAPSDDTG